MKNLKIAAGLLLSILSVNGVYSQLNNTGKTENPLGTSKAEIFFFICAIISLSSSSSEKLNSTSVPFLKKSILPIF